jgi:superfamily I DNA/RNA helicase
MDDRQAGDRPGQGNVEQAVPDRCQFDDPARIAVVPVTQVKGLEFDHVVLVDPHRIVELAPVGHRLLYISLTRAISRLTIIHTADLPEILMI